MTPPATQSSDMHFSN